MPLDGGPCTVMQDNFARCSGALDAYRLEGRFGVYLLRIAVPAVQGLRSLDRPESRAPAARIFSRVC